MQAALCRGFQSVCRSLGEGQEQLSAFERHFASRPVVVTSRPLQARAALGWHQVNPADDPSRGVPLRAPKAWPCDVPRLAKDLVNKCSVALGRACLQAVSEASIEAL